MPSLLLRTGLLLLATALLLLPVVIAWGEQAAVLLGGGAILLLLSYHLWQLQRLLSWLRGPPEAPLPVAGGIWDHIYAALERRRRLQREEHQQLTELLSRFQRAAEALPDGVITFNRLGQMDWINRQAEQHFALDTRRDLGQSITNLIRPPEFIAYLERGDYEEPLLLRNPRQAGATLLLQLIPYGQERILLLSRDVSKIERLETMRRDFVANVSHELKTPLTVVAGFAEMLHDEAAEFTHAEARHYLNLIHDQAVRMRRLIEDLLTLSALESATAKAEIEPVAVRPLLTKLLDEARTLSAGQHEITLELEGGGALLGCPTELRSALANLIVNAVRYTPAGGRIAVRYTEDEAGSVFAVQDSGIGIDPAHIPRLTERFYRVDRGRSRESGGTGLGLAIVKHVLTRHDAVLEIDSESGRGSCFRIRFPLGRVRHERDSLESLA